MKRPLLFFVFFCGLTMKLFSQTTFIRHYGEFTGRAFSLLLNPNGNYIVAGKKYASSKYDQFCTYELNSVGDTVWLKLYGTDSSDQTNQIIQTIDGGYATIGFASGVWSNYRSIFFVKSTNTGNASWMKQFGGFGRENGTSIVQVASGEYFIGGTSSYNTNGLFDYYLIKTDVNGDTIWTKKYGGSQNEEVNAMRQTSDGGLILSGYSESFSNGQKDFYLVKLNSSGDTLWSKHYGGNLDEVSLAVIETTDSGYVLTGYSRSFGISGYDNMYVVKTNSVGDILWTKTYGHVGRYSQGNDIIQTTDGGYAITGLIKTASSNGGFDLYLVKIGASGNLQWEREFKIEPTNTNYTSSEGRSIIQSSDGGFVIAGHWFSGISNELLFIKTNNDGTVGINEAFTSANFSLFPNPFSTQLTLTLSNNEPATVTLYDVFSRQVLQQAFTTSTTINTGQLANGIYFYELRNGKGVMKKGKVVKQ